MKGIKGLPIIALSFLLLAGFGSGGKFLAGQKENAEKKLAHTASEENAKAETPVGRYGRLRLVNNHGRRQLADEAGNPVQLKGMSTFGLQWDDGSWVLNDQAFDALAQDWECDVIRLAMYITEGGYGANPALLLERVEKGIALATARGLYVIVDWHILNPGDPSAPVYANAGKDLPQYEALRKAHPEYTGPQLFFAYLAQKYGHQPNLLWELCNEPNGLGDEQNAAEVWRTRLLPYCQGLADVIRAHEPEGNAHILICGTDHWSQFVDAPLEAPVKDLAEQTMYAFHFYAGTHDTQGSTWLKDKVISAMDNGLAVFCTEWGTSEASGNGGPYLKNAEGWIDFMEEHKISWCAWSLAKKQEASAAVLPCAGEFPAVGKDGVPRWNPETELSRTGRYIRMKIKE